MMARVLRWNRGRDKSGIIGQSSELWGRGGSQASTKGYRRRHRGCGGWVSFIAGKRCTQGEEVVKKGQGVMESQEKGTFRAYIRVGLRVLRDRRGVGGEAPHEGQH